MDRIVFIQEEPRGPSQLVEVEVRTNGLQRQKFPDVQQLRSTADVKIITKAIRLIAAEVLTNGPITGLAASPVAELQKMTLVIYCEGWEKAQYIPVLTLGDMEAPGSTLPHRFHPTKFDDWLNIDWSKCYLQYSNGTVSAGAPYCVMFDVEYVKLDASDKEIKGPS